MLIVNTEDGKRWGVNFKHTTQAVALHDGEQVERKVTYATLYDTTNDVPDVKVERVPVLSSFMIVNPSKSASKYTRRKEAFGKMLREHDFSRYRREAFWDAFSAEWGLY